MKIEIKKTQRGFKAGEFKDHYGEACSIQESSLASPACIWLGMNHETVHHATGEPCGARMHLTQDMAAALIPLLRKFVRHGYI